MSDAITKAVPGEHHWAGKVRKIARPWANSVFEEMVHDADPDRMHVMYIGFSDQRGGAAIASGRLISKLEARGDIAPLEIVTLQKGHAPWTVSIDRAHRFFGWRQMRKAIAARNVIASDPYGWLPFETAYIRRAVEAWSPEIIHIHNIHGGRGTMPLSLLEELARAAPIVWTLHDMWATTGHCAYSLECEGWKTGCSKCPHLGYYPSLQRDRAGKIVEDKRRIFEAAQPVLVPPSRWLGDIAQTARATAGLEVRVLANGVDLTVFNPAVRDKTRAGLGIAPDRQVLMFAAESLAGDTRKGARELRGAVEHLQAARSNAAIDIILMGGSGEELLEGIAGLEIHRPGFISDPQEAAGLYAAADLFICPSLQDNLPNTLVEASACGTASVAFDIGGCPEIIEHGVTGAIVPEGDARAMGEAIAKLLDDPALLAGLGSAARERAEALYSDDRMASDYLALYRELAGRRST